MPLLQLTSISPPDPGTPGDPGPARIVDVTWTAPDGTVEPLMTTDEPGAHLLAGVLGFGSAPREVTRQSLFSGGGYGRWSHVEERLVTLPFRVAGPDHMGFVTYMRRFARLFTMTTPASNVPMIGWLTVERSDGTHRKLGCHYLDGLGGDEAEGRGIYHDLPVIQLVAPDPWWYSDQVRVLEWKIAPNRNYLAPYETVSSDRSLGAQTINVLGDAPASPVWTIIGPATSVTARFDVGPGWTFGAVASGETITIDTEKSTVTNQTGANRISGLAWPTSSLYQLNPGANQLVINVTGGTENVTTLRMAYAARWERA